MSSQLRLYFVLVLLFSFEVIFADANFDSRPYRHFIKSIVADKFKLKNGEKFVDTNFILTNNSSWHISKNDSWCGTKPFPVNSEIFISPRESEDYSDMYWFEPKGKDGIAAGWLESDSENFLLTFVKVHVVRIKEAGWFTSPEYIHVVELSDGSKWLLKYGDGGMEKWDKGDHVIVSAEKGSIYKKWIVINCDKIEKYKLSDRSLNNNNYNKPFRYRYLYDFVVPYLEEPVNTPNP